MFKIQHLLEAPMKPFELIVDSKRPAITGSEQSERTVETRAYRRERIPERGEANLVEQNPNRVESISFVINRHQFANNSRAIATTTTSKRRTK